MFHLKTYLSRLNLIHVRLILFIAILGLLSLYPVLAQNDTCPVPDPCPGVNWNPVTNRSYGAGYNYYWSYDWLRCSYEFGCVNPPYAPTVTIHQDGVPPSTYTCPSPYIYNQHPTIDVWHYESCGDVCCEKTYAICVQHNAVDNIDEIVIKNVDRHKLNGSSCTLNNQFHKWDPPGTVVIPCEDGCQGDGSKY